MALRSVITCTLLLLLTGCFITSTFGTYWDRGILDEELLGKWKTADTDVSGNIVEIIEGDGVYTYAGENNSNSMIRSLDFKERKMLMITDGDKNNILFFYRIHDHLLTLYSPKPELYEQLLDIAPKTQVTSDSPTFGRVIAFPELTPEVYVLLNKAVYTPELWEPMQTFEKF